jgi:hypothetical protein
MLEYAIWQDTGSIAPMPSNEPIGEPGAAGSGLRVSKTLGEQGIEIQGVTYDQYQYSFELEAAVGLSGNTRYWFSIYLGQPTNLTLSTGFLWQQTDASGIAAISPAAIDGSPFLTLDADTLPPATWQSLSPARNLALRFYGERMPVVGTNWLLAPVVMALIAWRQSRGTRKSALA